VLAQAILPTNLPAEREVLGAVIEDEALLAVIVECGLSAEDFSLSDHQQVFRTILSLHEKQCGIDHITVADALGNSAESYVLVSSLVQGVVLHEGHVLDHVRIVLRKSQLRKLLKLAEWITTQATETAEPNALIEAILRKVNACRIK
jgi:replicative DNA helicase